ncbi:hypothetical protein RCL1_003455 [Eukaryota sp. TZLM3-RCL]
MPSCRNQQIDLSVANAMISEAYSNGREIMSEYESKQLLASYDIPVCKTLIAKTADDAALLADEMGYPVVVKIHSEIITHKSNVGGVVLNLQDRQSVIDAFVSIKANVERLYGSEGDHFLGVTVQQMISLKGFEVIIGAHIDATFGPVILFGTGGTLVEVYKDTAIATPPLQQESALRLIQKTKIYNALKGFRGMPACNMEELVSILVKFSELIQNHPEIQEIEINPLIVSHDQIVSLDCRVLLFPKGEARSSTLVEKPLHKIDSLLEPKSAIIAGASSKNSLNPCSVILSNLINFGIEKSNLYCLHPSESSIQGVSAFPSLDAITSSRDNKPVDLLVIGVPAKSAGILVEQAIDSYVAHSILVISAGFAETEAGKELSDRLQSKLMSNKNMETRPVLNGPNTVGCIRRVENSELSTVFVPRWKSSSTTDGLSNIALICQSGGLMISRLSNMAHRLSPSFAATVGNQMDLSVTDFLEHLLPHPDAQVFSLYIEGLNDGDGKRLMELITEARKLNKFVVVYKAGRSKQGQDAAKGHTASMAGDYNMFKNLIRSVGGIVVNNLSEFERVSMLLCCWTRTGALSKLIERQQSIVSVGALSNAGFEKCAIADHLFSEDFQGIQLCKWSEASIVNISAAFNKFKLSEVIDIGDVIDVTPMLNDEGNELVVRAMMQDPQLDVLLYATVPETLALNTLAKAPSHNEDCEADDAILARLVRLNREFSEKLMVLSIESGERYEAFRVAAFRQGLACFAYADEAARAVELVLASLFNYQ